MDTDIDIRHHFLGTNLLATLSRFSLVGVCATLTYFVTANLLILSGAMEPATASVIGYLVGMPVSYFGQSRITFYVTRDKLAYVFRFCIMTVCGLTISYVSVRFAADELKVEPVWGTVAASIAVPIMSFVVMKIWVFSRNA